MSNTWPSGQLYYTDNSRLRCFPPRLSYDRAFYMRHESCNLLTLIRSWWLHLNPNDMCFVKRLWHTPACVQCFCAPHSVLLCARPRPVTTWCNNNDVTTMTGLPVRHYGFVFDTDLLKQTGHRQGNAARHLKCFTENACFSVARSIFYICYTLI